MSALECIMQGTFYQQAALYDMQQTILIFHIYMPIATRKKKKLASQTLLCMSFHRKRNAVHQAYT